MLYLCGIIMNQKLFLKHFILIALLSVPVFTGCLFYRITGIPCPGCGVSRAWLNCFRGNPEAAFSYHPFFLLLPLIIFCYIHLEALFWRVRHSMRVFLICSAALLFIWYLFRLHGLI